MMKWRKIQTFNTPQEAYDFRRIIQQESKEKSRWVNKGRKNERLVFDVYTKLKKVL